MYNFEPFQHQPFWNAAAPGARRFSDSGTKRTVIIFKHPNFLISGLILLQNKVKQFPAPCAKYGFPFLPK